MKTNNIALLFCALLIPLAASAQGLKGAAPSVSRPSPLPLMSGKTVQQRWELVGKNAPTLVGKTTAEIEKIFGLGACGVKPPTISYRISENPKPGVNRYDHITFWFDKDGKVYKFTAEDKPLD